MNSDNRAWHGEPEHHRGKGGSPERCSPTPCRLRYHFLNNFAAALLKVLHAYDAHFGILRLAKLFLPKPGHMSAQR